MIDLHCHILPGLDDGARTVEEAREIARTAAAQGITAIAATPHVRPDYPTTAGRMESAVEALRSDFRAEGIPVEVLHGGEISLDLLWNVAPADLARFSLAQTRAYLLVEFPYRGWPPALDLAISTVRGRGMLPILGHPERNPQVQDRPDRLTTAVDAGALVQVTAASLDGRLDPASRSAAEHLIELELVHLIASDAHGPHIRGAGLADAVVSLADGGLARYLTVDVPNAIVAGKPLPPRPSERRSSQAHS